MTEQRAQLLKEADRLGLEYPKNISTEKLEELINGSEPPIKNEVKPPKSQAKPSKVPEKLGRDDIITCEITDGQKFHPDTGQKIDSNSWEAMLSLDEFKRVVNFGNSIGRVWVILKVNGEEVSKEQAKKLIEPLKIKAKPKK